LTSDKLQFVDVASNKIANFQTGLITYFCNPRQTKGSSDQVHTTGFSRVALNFYLDEQGGVYQVETTGFSRVEVQFPHYS
jgi:hypothetical protein